MFYRGFIDLPSSLVVSFFSPWALAMIVHQYHVVLSLTCAFAALVAIPLTLSNSFVLFMKTIKEAGLFETNFRLSLKQMYDGDRLSTQPPSQFKKDYDENQPQPINITDNETTQASSHGWEELPTTRMLRKSRQSFEDLYDSEDDDDNSSQDGGKYHLQSGEVDNLSEFSELLVSTEQA